MENKTGVYETLFIVDSSMGEEKVKNLVEKFTGMIADNGTVTAVNEWGNRKLAYPIDDKNDGYYVLVDFTANTAFVAELERVFNITDGIMRSMVVAKNA
jgi:small subunit ribosomal protein S6